MSDTDTMKEVYLLAQEHCGLKVGDFVKVTREAKNYEAGWDKNWNSYKSQAVGFIGRIIGDMGSCGFRVRINGAACECDLNFPYFVLEKVEKPTHEFKPFDKVLVRDNISCIWHPDIFFFRTEFFVVVELIGIIASPTRAMSIFQVQEKSRSKHE